MRPAARARLADARRSDHLSPDVTGLGNPGGSSRLGMGALEAGGDESCFGLIIDSIPA